MENNNGIFCPLLFLSNTITDPERWDCRKEKCAWWIEDKQKCAVAAEGERSRGK